MSDFFLVLQFSWIPFVGAAIYSLIAAPLGAVLSLRDEILLGLALPPVGGAAVVFAVMLGVDPESSWQLYLAAVSAILALSLLLPGRSAQGTSGRRRAALLAGVFCAGEAATLLMGAASPRVEAHVHDMLRGEVLAMSSMELMGFLLLTLLALALSFRFRGVLFALALDEEGLLVRYGARGRKALFGFRVAGALIIASGVIWVGPLLTLGLLAVPALMFEGRARGLASLFRGVSLLAFAGTTLGFLASIWLDLPPVPMVVAFLFICGGVVRLAGR